ncbi:MAG: ATP-binding protein, partial [Microgenomates group bacterium]
ATTPSVISGHPGGCNIFLNNLKNNYVRYTNFGVITKNGEIVCAADLEQALVNPPSLDLIQETIKSNGFSIGAYYPTKSGNSVINFAYPIDQNSLIYASLSLDWISDFVSNLDIPTQNLVINILDKNGTVLARHPKTESAIGKNFASDALVQEILTKGHGQTTKVGIDNILRFYTFTSLDNTHTAYVAVGMPRSLLYQSTRESLLSSLALILGISLISFFFAQKIGGQLIIKQMKSLQNIDKLKDEFVSLASHQLRSPMTAIRWLSESLLESKSDYTKKQYYSITNIHATTLRLITLTSTLLNISRLESGTLTPRTQQLNLKEIIAAIIQEMYQNSKQKSLKINSQSKISRIMSDPFLLSEIIRILLDNAIKYASPRSTINLIATKDHQNLVLSITNLGIGIPRESIPQIFTRFYRADNARASLPDGNGLGLYLARLIAHKLGGELSFTSLKDAKTTFTLTIPNEVL